MFGRRYPKNLTAGTEADVEFNGGMWPGSTDAK
jgi:hypothetical protein